MQYVHELTIYYVLSGLVGILILRRAQRLTTFFWAGASIGSVGAAIILAYRLTSATTDLLGLLTLIGAAYIFGLASAGLAVLLQFVLAPLLDLTTPLQLIDVSQPDHPLLQYILRNSPGTYQHSLQVANLAEQAAERIGANALLTRVGSLYHDAGKAQNPYYFIENQIPGYPNPHDSLPAEDSARIIIQHVHDGLELASKYRLPRRISEFISEHHGSLITRYQYAKAIEEAGGEEEEIDLEFYRYPGPRPQSRETALLMLADGAEARLRAERPSTESETRKIIKDLIDNRMEQGQLADTDLTLRDLNEILESFVATLRGVHHPRIEYPEIEINDVEVDNDTTGEEGQPAGEELTTIPSSPAKQNPKSES
jgi:putative nucleotidyltransferase with HDIG domain